MGASQSKNGDERTMMARILDPNGLLLEQTEGWESGRFQENVSKLKTTRSIEDELVRSRSENTQLSLHIGDTYDAQEDTVPEHEFSSISREQVSSTQTYLDIGMSRIATPRLSKWLADGQGVHREDSASSGEEIFASRRHASQKEVSVDGLVSSMHRRAKSLTGLPFNYEDSSYPKSGV